MRNTDHTSSQDETKEKAKAEEEKEEEEEEEVKADIKSNNPHLTGGEKQPSKGFVSPSTPNSVPMLFIVFSRDSSGL